MRILVLGGTAWLGGEVAREALGRGHEVTALARGESGRPPTDVTLAGRTGPGLTPTTPSGASVGTASSTCHASRACPVRPGALADQTAHWVFVSSCSVYAAHDTPGLTSPRPCCHHWTPRRPLSRHTGRGRWPASRRCWRRWAPSTPWWPVRAHRRPGRPLGPHGLLAPAFRPPGDGGRHRAGPRLPRAGDPAGRRARPGRLVVDAVEHQTSGVFQCRQRGPCPLPSTWPPPAPLRATRARSRRCPRGGWQTRESRSGPASARCPSGCTRQGGRVSRRATPRRPGQPACASAPWQTPGRQPGVGAPGRP